MGRGDMMTLVSFFGTVFFTVLTMISLVQQNKQIVKAQSGESVSVVMNVYMLVLFFAFGIYGLAKGSVALTFNGMIGFFYVPILWNLRKFQGFKFGETEFMFVLLFPLLAM